jgi:hypothetical protein
MKHRTLVQSPIDQISDLLLDEGIILIIAAPATGIKTVKNNMDLVIFNL